MTKSKRVMNCGCIVGLDYDGTLKVFYCPKHKAAPELYEALKEMLYDDIPGTQAIRLAEVAIAKAEVK